MKLYGKFFLAVLAFSLLSYGISGAAYAAVEPLSVQQIRNFMERVTQLLFQDL